MPSIVKLPKKYSVNLFRLIGIIHGDGNMSFNRIHISDKSLDYHKMVLQPLFMKLFNLRLNLYRDKGRNSYYSHIKNKVVYKFLTDECLIPKGAVRKNIMIPIYFSKVKDKLIASYIGGIYDSESYVSKRQAEIGFSTTSKVVYDLIKRFLNKKEIKNSYRIRLRRENPEYEIQLYGRDNISKFLKVVKIKHPDKISRLKQFFPLPTKDPSSPSSKRCEPCVAYSS